ncbi:ABC transporter ATP-binding protein [Oceanispirochaeta crateris]|uniref:ABC transporter ATP-binding protein n=1 Tax=Oceanispirochaeta crateris TaxID=2518645 RepID=A0A5C1QQC4_9SPIO|nr:ABC transporter ATP-binding protein [Oceanispirochaeta crateris]QEN09717.1 ABC transporter ATP-binding protein [Oceanispirochaeta crateris]
MRKLKKLEMRGISKSFIGVKANQDVNLNIQGGDILGLLGENGAGKTTLMNILYGLYLPDEGQVLINDNEIRLRNPKDSMQAGIGMIHQHFMLIQKHTVLENIALGYDGAPFFFPQRYMREQIKEYSERFGLDVDPDKKIWELSAGEQQRVEILKALFRNADLLIMDEPTSVLTPQEAEDLFDILRKMTKEGHTVILISHKLEEIMAICNSVMVMRKGKVTGNARIEDVTQKDLARMMIGREISSCFEKSDQKPGEAVLEVNNLCVNNDQNRMIVNDLSFKLHQNEILGVAGVSGNGQREMVEAITGLRHALNGQVFLQGEEITNISARKIHDRGITHVPEERIKHGTVSTLQLYENSVLKQHHRNPFSFRSLMNYPLIKAHAEKIVKSYNVDAASINTPIKNLSGGNIQKLILGREISAEPDVLIAAHPTYGLDVGAAEYIRKELIVCRDRGGAVLLVSEDLEELFQVCDRIAVMFEGRFMGIVNPQNCEMDDIGLMMAGAIPEFSPAPQGEN